jgi:hypothetical protein
MSIVRSCPHRSTGNIWVFLLPAEGRLPRQRKLIPQQTAALFVHLIVIKDKYTAIANSILPVLMKF